RARHRRGARVHDGPAPRRRGHRGRVREPAGPGERPMIRSLLMAVLLAVGAGVAPLGADAQTPRVGLLSIGTDPARPSNWDPFVEEMSRRGYVDGRTIVFERRFAAGQGNLIAGMAEDLVRQKVAVIVA